MSTPVDQMNRAAKLAYQSTTYLQRRMNELLDIRSPFNSAHVDTELTELWAVLKRRL